MHLNSKPIGINSVISRRIAHRVTKGLWGLLLFLFTLQVIPTKAVNPLTINATDDYSINAVVGTAYDVTISNRTFTAGKWDIICLPFDASQEVLDAAFGADNYKIQEFDTLEGTKFKFKEMEAPSLSAGYAYFIQVTNEVENPVFNNVTIKMTSENEMAHQGSETVFFIGNFFPKAGWDLINNYHAFRWYNDNLMKMAYMGDGTPQQSTIPGAHGFFATDGDTTITVALASTGGGNGDDDSLATKIANREQLTNVPTMYIDIPDVNDLDTDLSKDRTTGIALYHHATIKVIATDDADSPHYCESFEETSDQDLEIKVRGNSTADPSKRAYRLKFANKKTSSDGKAHKHDLLGRGYSKRNWVLLANAFDNSLIRNALTSELSSLVGMPFVPGYKFIDLVINGEYRGCYQVTDHCEVDPDRINVDEDTGWYVEFQGRGDMLDQPVCFSSPILMNVKNPEPADETDEQALNEFLQPFKDYFQNVWLPSFNEGYTDPLTGWRSTNEEDVWLKFLIVTEITADYDGLMSVKACREADGKLMPNPVWDKDLAYGNITCSQDDILVPYVPNGQVPRMQVQVMYQDPAFIKRMKETFDQMVADGLKETLYEKIDMLAALVTETRQLNYDRWGVTPPIGSMQVFYQWQDYEPYVQQLKDWLDTRIDVVQQLLTEKYEEAMVVTDFTYDVSSSSFSATKDRLMNVTMINRSFAADKWNAITLPFSADEDLLKTVFGEQFELREFADVYAYGTRMLFVEPLQKCVFAGVPYLIKPSKSVDPSPVFENVTVSYSPGWRNNQYENGKTVTHGDYSFQGMITKTGRKTDGTELLIAEDGTTLYVPEKINSWDQSVDVNGSIAFISIAENAAPPSVTYMMKGDANGDGCVDVADFISVANDILGTTPVVFIHQAADVNDDGVIDVADFIGIANIILKQESVIGQARKDNSDNTKTDDDSTVGVIYVEPANVCPDISCDLIVKMKNTLPVAAFQFRLVLPEGITVQTDDGVLMTEMSMKNTKDSDNGFFSSSLLPDGSLNVLCAMTTKDLATGRVCTFDGDDDVVVRISLDIPSCLNPGRYDVSVIDAVAVDDDGRKICVKTEDAMLVSQPEITGIEVLVNETDGLNNQSFTIDGREVLGQPTLKGIYIVKGKKIVIR